MIWKNLPLSQDSFWHCRSFSESLGLDLHMQMLSRLIAGWGTLELFFVAFCDLLYWGRVLQ